MLSRKKWANAKEEIQSNLNKWDAGEAVWSVEMGGLGPSYEQAIQVLIIELIRDNLGKPLPVEKPTPKELERGVLPWTEWGNPTVHRINEVCRGFSGAQVGAAKSVAFRILRDGWEKAIKSAPEERRIQIDNWFPKVPNAA